MRFILTLNGIIHWLKNQNIMLPSFLKKYFLVSIVFVSVSAKAQTEYDAQMQNFLPEKFMQIQSPKPNKISTAKTTATDERVIAKVIYESSNDSIRVIDSTTYLWSGANGSIQTGNSIVIDLYDSSKSWFQNPKDLKLKSKRLRTYNADNQYIEELIQNWNDTFSIWEDVNKFKYKYSGKNQTYKLMVYFDPTTKSWLDLEQTFSKYDGDALIEQYKQWWDKRNSVWDNKTKFFMTYKYSKLIEYVTQECRTEDNVWVNSAKQVSTYDGNNLTMVVEYNWDKEKSLWLKARRYLCSYSGNDPVLSVNEYWSDDRGDWFPETRYSRSYLDGKLRVTELDRNSGGTWYKGRQDTYDYTGSNLTSRSIKHWYDSIADWRNTDRVLWAYNDKDKLVSEKREYWDLSSKDWQPYSNMSYVRTFYYYENYTPLDTPVVKKLDEVFLYPNPATAANVYVDYFTEKSESTDVVLSNILGQEILRKTEPASIGDHSVMIPVSSLSSGMYVVSIYSNGQLQKTMKLVK